MADGRCADHDMKSLHYRRVAAADSIIINSVKTPILGVHGSQFPNHVRWTLSIQSIDHGRLQAFQMIFSFPQTE
jgi:hypothetical protein